MEGITKTCCICDAPISEKYLEFLKKMAAIPSYIDTCQDHGHLRHSFDLKKPPGENLEHLKHLRVEHGNDSEI